MPTSACLLYCVSKTRFPFHILYNSAKNEPILIILVCLIHTVTLRRNLISLAIFNAIFWKIGGGLLFLCHPVYLVKKLHLNPMLLTGYLHNTHQRALVGATRLLARKNKLLNRGVVPLRHVPPRQCGDSIWLIVYRTELKVSLWTQTLGKLSLWHYAFRWNRCFYNVFWCETVTRKWRWLHAGHGGTCPHFYKWLGTGHLE